MLSIVQWSDVHQGTLLLARPGFVILPELVVTLVCVCDSLSPCLFHGTNLSPQRVAAAPLWSWPLTSSVLGIRGAQHLFLGSRSPFLGLCTCFGDVRSLGIFRESISFQSPVRLVVWLRTVFWVVGNFLHFTSSSFRSWGVEQSELSCFLMLCLSHVYVVFFLSLSGNL